MSSQTTPSPRHGELRLARRDRAEQLTNAVYGSILVTAFLGAVDDRVSSAAEIVAEMVAASVVLFVAHTYASLLATGIVERGGLREHAGMVVRNQLPLMTVVAIPSLFLLLATMDLLTLDTALVLAIGAEIIALFGLGYVLTAESGQSSMLAVASGVLGAGLGMVVIGLETALH